MKSNSSFVVSTLIFVLSVCTLSSGQMPNFIPFRPVGELECDQVPEIPYGRLEKLPGYSYLDLTVWRVACNDNAMLIGSNLVTCTPATGWSRITTLNDKCQPTNRIECSPLGLDNGAMQVTKGSEKAPTSATIVCKEGFKVVGASNMTCDHASGTWSQVGSCQLERELLANPENDISCRTTSIQIENGYAEVNRWNRNVAAVSCCPGYDLRGNLGATCGLQTGWKWTWNGKCVANKWLFLTCEEPPAIENGFIGPGCLQHTTKRAVICNPGYHVDGPNTISCTGPNQFLYWSAPGRCIPPGDRDALGFPVDEIGLAMSKPTRRGSSGATGATGPRLGLGPPPQWQQLQWGNGNATRGSIPVTESTAIATKTTTPSMPKTTTKPIPALIIIGGPVTRLITTTPKRKCGGKVQSDSLITAIIKGDSIAFNKQLASTADVNTRDNITSMTALMWAASSDQIEFARQLIDCGADINVTNSMGSTPLLLAAQSGSVNAVRLLLERKANPNRPNDFGMTPLIWAVESGFIDIAKLLLQNKANQSFVDADGWNAIMWAAEKNSTEMLDLLLKFGADANFRVSTTKETPLMVAAANGNVEAVSLLLQRGADVDAKDSKGRTAADRATPEIATVLSKLAESS